MADGKVLIGIKDEGNFERKTYTLFDGNKKAVATTSLLCNDSDSYGTVLQQSIQNLQGTHVKLACEVGDACVGRDFYDLDLMKLLDGSTEAMTPMKDERYDCGYRG